MKRWGVFLLLLVFSPCLFAKVYKCTVNGRQVYSQAQCGADSADVRIYDADKFHYNDIRRTQLKKELAELQRQAQALGGGQNGQNGQNNYDQAAQDSQDYALRAGYESARAELIEELDGIDLEPIQKFFAGKSGQKTPPRKRAPPA